MAVGTHYMLLSIYKVLLGAVCHATRRWPLLLIQLTPHRCPLPPWRSWTVTVLPVTGGPVVRSGPAGDQTDSWDSSEEGSLGWG